MPRTQISIKLDEDLLGRIDQLAVDEGNTRTGVIERALRDAIPQQEWFNRTLENPLVRTLHKQLTSSPAVLKLLAMIVQEDMSEEDIQRLSTETGPRMRESAKARSERNKVKRRPKAEGA